MADVLADRTSQGEPGIVVEAGIARSDQGSTIEGMVLAEPMNPEWGLLLLAAALSLAWGLLVSW